MQDLLTSFSEWVTVNLYDPVVWSVICAVLTVIFIYTTNASLNKSEQININNFKLKSLRENSDSEAKSQYEALFGKAQNSLKVYDDGDANSIYNEGEFAEKLVGFLQAKPDLEVKILFNEQEDTEFTKLIKQLHRNGELSSVVIKHRVSDAGIPTNVHVKIIDNGKYTHLSKHDLGGQQRVYELWACEDITYLDDRFKRRISNFDELFATADLITSSSTSDANSQA